MTTKTIKEGKFKLISEFMCPRWLIRLYKNSDSTFTVEEIDTEEDFYTYFECAGSGPALSRYVEQVFRRLYRIEFSDIDIDVNDL